MHENEILALSELLGNLYGDRWPGLTPAMADIWHEDLIACDEDLVRQALRRWVRFHSDRPPSLDQICEQVEIVRDDQARSRLPAKSKSYAEILRDAADAQASNPLRTEDDATYGHLMATLAQRSIDRWQDEQGLWHPKLTMEQRGMQCYAWASQYEATNPQLAGDLEQAGRQFAKTFYAQR